METILNGITYKIGRLPAREQFHVVRRLSPMVTSLSGILSEKGERAVSLAPLTEILSTMDDKAADYIINTCLSVVQRKQDKGLGWANIMMANGLLMFEDIKMSEMMQLAFEVIKDNLGDFFAALPSILNPGRTTAG